MRKRKINGKELAARLGSPQSSVSRWVSGTQEPRAAILVRIARVLEVSLDELICGETDELRAVRTVLDDLEDTGYVSLLDGQYRIHLKIEKKIDSKSKEGK